MKRAFASLAIACMLAASGRARADDVVIGGPGSEPSAATATPHTTYFGLVSGGASYRRLFGLPVEAADIGLGFGADSRGLGLYVRGDFEAGRADRGLTTRTFRLGGSAEGIVGRFRLGGGVDVLRFSVWRVTDSTTIDELGVGAFMLGSLDVVRFDGHALFLGVRGDVDWIHSSAVFGASATLGFRL